MATSMKHIVVKPQSPQWHTWRMAGIGGSDAPVIAADAGLCKPAKWMKSIENLWKVKTGKTGDFGGNWATRRGQAAEPIARANFEKQTGILLSPIYGEMAENPIIRSSFDGVDFSGNIIGECKLGSEHVHMLVREGQIPEYYKPQVAHQAMTAWGMPESWTNEQQIAFISHHIDSNETLFVMVPALELRSLAEPLYQKELEFWKRVKEDAEPCGEDWKFAASQFLMVRAQMEALEAQEDEAKARLIELLGDGNKMSGAGVSVTKQNKQGSIDYSKIVAEHLSLTPEDIEKYRKSSSTSTVVRVL